MNFASMTLGQYVPRESVIHRLDPRVKLFAIMLLVTVVWTADTPIALVCNSVLYVILVYTAGFGWKIILRSCKPVLYLVAFTFVFNLVSMFWFGTGNGINNNGTLHVIIYAGFTALRLLVLMLFALLLPLTTAPLELADGIEELLMPLSRFKFPAHECAMMIGMALRFIPLLMEETDRIIRAQLSRGARLDQGNIFKRMIAFVPVMIPLFIIIFRRADEMALAMEARGYSGGAGRTRRCPLHWSTRDTVALILTAGFAIASLIINL